jgi:type II secretory pathway component PulM
MATALPALRMPTPVARWLATKTPVERRSFATLFVVGTMALLWAVLWQPLTRDASALRGARTADAAALAQARAIVDEMRDLAKAPAPSAPPDARADLERILLQRDLRPAVTQLEWREGRARVVFTAVAYDALIVALETLQREARLRPVEATLTARVEPGMVRAELTLAR